MTGILVLFHCESNPGYAASSHEFTFLEVAIQLTKEYKNIHYSYPTLQNGMTKGLPYEKINIIEFDTKARSQKTLAWIEKYIRQHDIKYALGFDQPVSRPAYHAMRKGGLRYFVSYWGAPMSSINTGLKLALKRLEVILRSHGPQHYIFQSTGMLETATKGRGINPKNTSIVKTGIDTTKYCPSSDIPFYCHDLFDIPKNRKIIVFSGHMERRKGVHIAIQAAGQLINNHAYSDFQLLILGNRKGEERSFSQYLENANTRDHVTFGGYRNDLDKIFKSSCVGIIASTEWDSFPMSSLEMAACELPLVVSDIPGLNETITNKTGIHFPRGDYKSAANALFRILQDQKLAFSMGKAARSRVVNEFSRDSQVKGILHVFNNMAK